MKPWVSLQVGGARVDRGHGALLGEPCWDPHALLADLELRLGVTRAVGSDAERTDALAAALDRVAELGEGYFRPKVGQRYFFEASFAVDRAATADVLAGLREAALLTGWAGQRIPTAGARLDALVAIEGMLAADPPAFALGIADRLRSVLHALGRARSAPYTALRVLDPLALWPALWRDVFSRLEVLGAAVDIAPLFTDEQGSQALRTYTEAATVTDLERTKRSLTSAEHAATPYAWQGDGSLVWLRARTGWELAEAVAGLLRADDSDVLVVRMGDASALDAAFALQGLPTLGHSSSTTLRPPLAVLSLAMNLAFAPRDPQSALELLTLPSGPFQGRVARKLAQALAEFPAVGSPDWEKAKIDLTAPHTNDTPGALEGRKAALERVATWLEGPGLDRGGASKLAVLAAANRVTAWVRDRLHSADRESWTSLYSATVELERLLEREPRDTLLPHEVDVLVGRALQVMSARVSVEQAGRFAHVASPHGIGATHDTVIVWHAGWNPTGAPRRSPLRQREKTALGAAGFSVIPDDVLMDYEAHTWRRVVFAAKRRLIIATPESSLGGAQLSLPLWDEIVARTGNIRDRSAQASVTRSLDDILRTNAGETLPPRTLPVSRDRWTTPADPIATLLAAKTHWSPSSLEKLLGCPLRFVLEKLAKVEEGELASLPGDALLYGKLGDRLAEDLHARGVLGSVAGTQAQIVDALDDLVARHAATLMLSSSSDELAQLRDQLAQAMVGLSSLLEGSGLHVTSVQGQTTSAWGKRAISGRTDLVVEDGHGTILVIDLKWGGAKYREALVHGHALQLAVYATALQSERGTPKPTHAAYFSLSRAEGYQLRGGPLRGASELDGPSLADTWSRASRTTETVLAMLARGRIPVPPAGDGVPLVDLLGLSAKERLRHYERPTEGACTYCTYAALCGKKWEGRQ